MLGANRWLVTDCIIYTSIMELNRVFFGNSKIEDSKLESMKIYPRCPRGITLLSAVITSVLHQDWSNHWGNSYVGTYRTLMSHQWWLSPTSMWWLSPTSMSPESVNLVLITSCSSNSIFTCAFPCRIERTCRRIPQTTMRGPNSSNDFTSWVSLNQVYIVFFNREKLKDESLFLVIIIPILKSRKRFRIWKIRIQTRISRLTRVVFASTSCISLNVIVYAS